MYQGKKVSVILASAGTGTRMGTDLPKQFLKLGSKTILETSYEVMAKSKFVDEVLVIANERYVEETMKLLPTAKVVSGGKERQDSIQRGIEALMNIPYLGIQGDDLVLVHDAARPFVTEEVIERVVEAAYQYGAAIPGVRPKDTIRQGEETLDRNSLSIVQTPQGFRFELLKEAYEKAFSDGFYGTDDAGLVERIGAKVRIVEGDYENIKITTKEDMPVMHRIGTGFDVHKLVEGRDLILGGVKIPYEKGLLGHSDADVLAHAFMDALLGAAALGDIGKFFPDTDERYKGISSIELLKHVAKLLDEEGYRFVNGDITLIAERPKIAPYIDEMRKNIADAMGVGVEQIGIKGTTTEKLGFTGRGEGIASEAVCMLER